MKYFIVTGTTKGLGSAIKEIRLRDSDNTVIALNRNPDSNTNPNFINIKCDISNNEEIENAFNEIANNIVHLEPEEIVLINNAGVVDPIKFIQNASAEEIQKCFEINVLGTINTSRCFLKNFSNLDSQKAIVNISSGAASNPMAGWSVYTATKAAVEIFTKSVAIEQAQEDFPTKIFAFQPGKVETPMQEYVRNQKPEDLPLVDIFIQSHKGNQNFSPELIAEMLVRLLEEAESGEIYKARELKERFGILFD